MKTFYEDGRWSRQALERRTFRDSERWYTRANETMRRNVREEKPAANKTIGNS
jgi:hypothetical protein